MFLRKECLQLLAWYLLFCAPSGAFTSGITLREGTTLPEDWREQLLASTSPETATTTMFTAARRKKKSPPPPPPQQMEPPSFSPPEDFDNRSISDVWPSKKRKSPPPPPPNPPATPRSPQPPSPYPPTRPSSPVHTHPVPPPPAYPLSPRQNRRAPRSPPPGTPEMPYPPPRPSPLTPPRIPSPPPFRPPSPSPPPPFPPPFMPPSPPPPSPSPSPSPLFAPPSPPQPPAPPPPDPVWSSGWKSMPSYTQMVEFLQARVARSGGRCSLTSIGKSVQNRDIWLVTAGDPSAPIYPDPSYPELPYPKPAFAYIGNVHGDERTNLHLLLQFVNELCAEALPGRVRALLENTTVYVIPSMNPDGYNAFSRMNANGIDLNRNAYTADFPFARPDTLQVARSTNYYAAADFLLHGGAAMEPETKAVTAWLARVRPALSANLHGGAFVASYTLDACDSMGQVTYCESPEAPLPNFLANVYAQGHSRMKNSVADPQGLGRFVNGTTQGAAWYVALGTLGDWSHHSQRLHMLTLELHARKNPLASEDLVATYAMNRGSLLRLVEMTHLGLRARLLDATSRTPLRANVVLDQPAGMWAPQVEQGGYIWKLGLPNMWYSGTFLPYDPSNPTLRYAPVPFSFRVGAGWDEVIRSSGMAGLSVVRTYFANHY